MELWNDFEGKTVDGRFRLDHLIGPKGRSAYFTATDEAGAPVVVRLIESLNDEEEILTRWRAVRGLSQEHLVEVLACGQTQLDGTHLVYAVMEPTDAELSEVLRERALTPDEARQIALSVANGLEVLHGKGLIHEHVEAENVLAKGETVKLRSDVVREAPEGAEGAALRAKDVRDLSLLLNQTLTRSRTIGQGRLPVPFDEVIRKGEIGSWGLASMISALRPIPQAPRPVPAAGGAEMGRPLNGSGAVRGGAAQVPGGAGTASGGSTVSGGATAGRGNTAGRGSASSPSSSSTAAAVAEPPAVREVVTPPADVASRLAAQSPRMEDGVGAHLRSPRTPERIVLEPEAEPKRTGLFAAIAGGAILLLLLAFYFFRASSASQKRSVVQDTPSAVTVPQQSSENRPPAHDAASAPVPQPAERPLAAADSPSGSSARADQAVAAGAPPSAGSEWRVVAFTYNHENQAEQKAHGIAAKHPNLKPEVFSPHGRAPYLVTLGGWMSASQASSMRERARREGLPRDIYKQNYRDKLR